MKRPVFRGGSTVVPARWPLRRIGHRLVFLVTWAAMFLVASPVVVAGNALAGHASPYLALHGEDPVEWRDWGPAVLADAQRLNRPIFISSGYFSCHWCHVMQRESYRNAAIAERLNAHFIPVKLDRELHPAVDDHLIRFVERTRGQAGWPLNVFLSPQGYPMAGLTYLPPEDFATVLDRVADQWSRRGEALADLARQASASDDEDNTAADTDSPLATGADPQALSALLRVTALDLGDDLMGGFGHQSKFPMEPQLLALLELQARFPDERLAAFLRTTLTSMASRGLRDHLAGGFFRYTVDPDWRTPHFEKMLYNQAELARVYLVGARVLKMPEFNEVARDTLDFVLARMAGDDGGFIASLSAVDAAGEEGGAYLWDDERLSRVLSPEEKSLARAWWSLDDAASTSIGWLPQRLASEEQVVASVGMTPVQLHAEIPGIARKLLDERATRPPPRDHKRLAAWNGLFLQALAEAGPVLGERYDSAAAKLAVFLHGLWDGEKLYRSRDGVRVLGEASLEDYAYVAAGMAAWGRRIGRQEDLDLAATIADAGWRRFFGPTGWRMDGTGLLPGMERDAAMSDGALPAPSAVLMRVTAEGATDLGDGGLEPLQARALALSVQSVFRDGFWYATHAMALMDLGTMDRTRPTTTGSR